MMYATNIGLQKLTSLIFISDLKPFGSSVLLRNLLLIVGYYASLRDCQCTVVGKPQRHKNLGNLVYALSIRNAGL